MSAPIGPAVHGVRGGSGYRRAAEAKQVLDPQVCGPASRGRGSAQRPGHPTLPTLLLGMSLTARLRDAAARPNARLLSILLLGVTAAALCAAEGPAMF